jgi:hypothetical protein
VFTVLLYRLLQMVAVRKVEQLVPAEARPTSPDSVEYVVVVRGRAVFWFNGAAGKRDAARQHLLEHAKQLVDAERKPMFDVARLRKPAGLAVLAIAVAAGLILTGWSVASWIAHRPVAAKPRPAAARSAIVPAPDAGACNALRRLADNAALMSATCQNPAASGIAGLPRTTVGACSAAIMARAAACGGAATTIVASGPAENGIEAPTFMPPIRGDLPPLHGIARADSASYSDIDLPNSGIAPIAAGPPPQSPAGGAARRFPPAQAAPRPAPQATHTHRVGRATSTAD